MKGLVAPRLQGKERCLKIGNVTLRTSDRMIDLHEPWQFRQELLELAETHGVSFVDLRSDSFRAFAGTIRIVCNPPTTANRLKVLAHECAHIGFRHRKGYPRHRMEFEAETYSFAYLRSRGVLVEEAWIQDGKRYVADIIGMGIRRGVKRYDTESWFFADPSLLHRAYQKAFHGFTPELFDASEDNGFSQAITRLQSMPAML